MYPSDAIRHRVSVQRLVHGGRGLVRLPDGIAFVDGVAVGDLVEVGEPQRRGAARVAPLLAVLEPSADRVSPPCPIVDRCGGCTWQHIGVTAQRNAKRDILSESLRRVGGIEWNPAEIEMVVGDAWGYRSRVQLHGMADGRPAYRRRGSHELVAVDDCLVADPQLRSALPELRLAAGGRTTLVAGSGDAGEGVARSDRDSLVTVQLAHQSFRFHPGSFAQANHALLPELGRRIAGALADALPQSDPAGIELVDLYAGAGLLPALALAWLPLGVALPDAIICVEPDTRNLRLAAENIRTAYRLRAAADGAAADGAAAAEGPLVSCRGQRAEGAIHSGVLHKGRGGGAGATRLDWQAVLVDPPRAGLSAPVRTALTAAPGTGPDLLIYLSCDAATLARDLGTLTSAWEIHSISLLDFYPQTPHLETLVVLRPPESP